MLYFALNFRSLTDTSYFPTEDLNDVPEQTPGTETSSGSKDLAFLGYTVSLEFSTRVFGFLSETGGFIVRETLFG